MTRFSVHQREWKARPTQDWLYERWPLFERTAESVAAQTVPHEWWLICHYTTPIDYLLKLKKHGRVIIVEDHWLGTLQELMPIGPKITTRLDSDDIIAPDYLQRVQAAASSRPVPGFVCASGGYQYDGEHYYSYSEELGPFLSLVEEGNQTVYCRAHGNALRSERVHTFSERCWVQVIHSNNLKNKVRGEQCQKPQWAN